MASNTRSGRRPTAASSSTPPDVSSLSNLECLLLAQAVHELGTNAWHAVSKLLTKHPLVHRPKSFFTTQSCHAIYDRLMQEAELSSTEANHAPRAPVNLKLAQKFYQKRIVELYDLIAEEESKFKILAAEIEEIRAGKWDSKIKAEITGESIAEGETEHVSVPVVSTDTPELQVVIPPVEEPFGDSDLSGITESGSASREDLAKTPEFEPQTPDSNEVVEPEPRSPEHAPDAEAIAPPEQESEDREPPPKSPATEFNFQKLAGSANVSVVDEDEPTLPVVEEDKAMSDVGLAPADVSFEVDVVSVAPEIVEDDGQREEPEAEADDAMDVDDKPAVETPQEEDQSSLTDVATFRRRESKRKISFTEGAELSREKKRFRDESEPADEDEPGPSSGQSRRRPSRQTGEQVALKRFQIVIGMLHSQISQHRNGNIFHNPIKNSEAPDYHEIVKRPMDLKTIKTRIKDGIVSNSLEFQRDVYLMFANAMMYNRPGSDIYHMAEEMMLQSEMEINQFRQTEGFVRGGHRI